VISGFIMVYTSRNWFGKSGAWKVFIKRRLLRIVPLYWFYTFVLLGIALIMPKALETSRFEPVHFLKSLFFIPHHNPTGGFHPFLDLGWTLNYEMYFYAVFATLLFLPVQRMLIVLTVFFAGAVAAGFFISKEYAIPYIFSRPVVLEFVGGAWLGYAYIKGLRLDPVSLLLTPVLIGILFFMPLAPDIAPWLIQAIAIGFVALAILPRGMENLALPKPLSEMGNASYTLYLAHPFTLAAAALLLKKFTGPWSLLGISVVGAVTGGYILYLWVEKPLLSLTKGVFLRHEKAF
jgi:peptidoglycan/LPS O-acetylase OafA/YrhL